MKRKHSLFVVLAGVFVFLLACAGDNDNGGNSEVVDWNPSVAKYFPAANIFITDIGTEEGAKLGVIKYKSDHALVDPKILIREENVATSKRSEGSLSFEIPDWEEGETMGVMIIDTGTDSWSDRAFLLLGSSIEIPDVFEFDEFGVFDDEDNGFWIALSHILVTIEGHATKESAETVASLVGGTAIAKISGTRTWQIRVDAGDLKELLSFKEELENPSEEGILEDSPEVELVTFLFRVDNGTTTRGSRDCAQFFVDSPHEAGQKVNYSVWSLVYEDLGRIGGEDPFFWDITMRAYKKEGIQKNLLDEEMN